ncbi:MAG: hypothetical protein GY757_53635 [bacterium]|nr:hypothetical protein [bacterium]
MKITDEKGRELFKLGDRHPAQTRGPLVNIGFEGTPNIMAYNSRVKRPPKKGEFYLSGCNESGKPNAWRAKNDLTTAYYIAVPVRVHRQETVTFTTEPINQD